MRIVVGHDGSPRGIDALALCLLTRGAALAPEDASPAEGAATR